MLGAFESKLAAVLGDALNTRTHLGVVEAPGPGAAPVAGRGRLVASVRDVLPRQAFDAPAPRRTLPVSFTTRLHFGQASEDATDEKLAAARQLLTMDVSLAVFRLTSNEAQTGKMFESAGDAGYRILRFWLDRVYLSPDLQDGLLTAVATFRGEGEIWPVEPLQPQGVIKDTRVLLTPLPVRIVAVRPVLKAGEESDIRIEHLAASGRSLRLAIRVVSDLALDRRGTILSGQASAAENGTRLVDAGAAETVIRYKAPAAPLNGVRVEFVAVHVAPAGEETSGVLLGSAAMQLFEG